jgi:replicative superfamily II helicase
MFQPGNDKHQYFLKTYGEFGIRTIRATGEITDDIPDLMRGRFDICLMTYEKFAAMILGSPHILEQVGTVVIDEVQMITDKNRGTNLEFVLTLLRTRRSSGIEPQLIALCASHLLGVQPSTMPILTATNGSLLSKNSVGPILR